MCEEHNIPKVYDPASVEKKWYKFWEEHRYFHAEVEEGKEAFSIVIPPPNITGQLHMGHALDNTLQDILIRWHRMMGHNTLWMPGYDHAGLATQIKVEEVIKKEEGKTRYDLGREEFLKRVWEWKEQYGDRIINQLKHLGVSCDWERKRFTMDEGCSKAVQEVFIRLYEKGYIYKGSRIINWCPVCKTSISDAEVEYEEQAGHFWHIKYPIVGTDDAIIIATTRPETLIGDSALAVNPNDDRYKDLVGKMVELPLMNRQIPIIADEYVDMEFGTGVVKITPAHDPNDFQVGKRHNLPEINMLNDDATINENGGKYAGMDRYEARKAMVEDLKAAGLLVKVEDHVHNVGTHDRCKTTVEPMIKQQWFVKMDELIKPAADAVKNGDIKLMPERMEKTYFNWTDNIRDWCISRQLWWGHRIPAYYCDDCGEMVVSDTETTVCPKCGGHMTQDPDTLDTWFSSALWPFSTLGWPEKTEELSYFYPTDVLVTGYDIIFFWVIRMIFSGYEHMGEKPFGKVLFHGLVRDSQGRKMSKSLGNGIDPLEVIDKYGADALRLTLITGNAPGNDMRFYWERVEASRNFANKVWNATRFIMMNDPEGRIKPGNIKVNGNGGSSSAYKLPENLTAADKWILSRMNKVVAEVTENMEKYELGIAVSKLQDFIWDEFCDWYIEMVKPRLYNDEDTTKDAAVWTLKTVLVDALKMLHPYMPFVTEEIFCNLQDDEESIMISDWPAYKKELEFAEDENAIETIKNAVRNIRALRTDMNVAPSRKAKVYVVSENNSVRQIFENGRVFFATLGYASEVCVQSDKTGIADDAVSTVIPEAVIYMPFADLVDVKAEIERLEKEEKRLNGEIARCNGMLNNEKFTSKAPQAKIDEEKAKLVKYTQMLEQVKERLGQLK